MLPRFTQLNADRPVVYAGLVRVEEFQFNVIIPQNTPAARNNHRGLSNHLVDSGSYNEADDGPRREFCCFLPSESRTEGGRR